MVREITFQIFGIPPGLELYRDGKTASQKPLHSPPVPVPTGIRRGVHSDEMTPSVERSLPAAVCRYNLCPQRPATISD
jgi:hypothetical protein